MNKKIFKVCVKKSKEFTVPLYGFSEVDENAIFAKFKESTSFTFSPSFITSMESNFATSIDFSCDFDEIIQTPTSASFITSSPDCTGRKQDASFISDGLVLYVGKDTIGAWKSWIPFTVGFDVTEGIHITSAYLKLGVSETKARVEGVPCAIKIACEDAVNPESPTTYDELASRITTLNYYSDLDVSTWYEGEVKEFDITKSVKDVLGEEAITWTNGSTVGVILTNFGSAIGSYRTAVSYEGSSIGSGSAPYLEINYAENTYSDPILDTFITTGTTSATKYDSPQIAIGERNDQVGNIRRGLIKPNFSSIPYSPVTTACLCLYLDSNLASDNENTSLNVYRMLTEWDLYSASWERPYGTGSWVSGGSTVTDIDSTVIGTSTIAYNQAPGWVNITLTSGCVESWIAGSIVNHGMMLMMGAEEKNNSHSYASSRAEDHHPKMLIYTSSGSYKLQVE